MPRDPQETKVAGIEVIVWATKCRAECENVLRTLGRSLEKSRGVEPGRPQDLRLANVCAASGLRTQNDLHP